MGSEKNTNNLPEGWSSLKLKEVCNFIDYRGKTPNKTDSGIPLITAKNIRLGYINEDPREFIAEKDYEQWMTRGIPQKGDLIFTTEAPLGNIAELKYEEKFAVAQRAIVLHLHKNYNSTFLKYQILSTDFQKTLTDKATGTTVKGIKASILKEIEVSFPNPAEQERIVAKLDALFEKLDAAIKLAEENLEHLSHLLPSALNEVFEELCNKFIPVSLVKHVDFIGGSQPAKTQFLYEEKKGYVRLIQIRDYKSDNHKVYINEKSTTKFCTEDDIMIGRYGPPVFQILRGLKGAYNVALMKAQPDESVILKDFLYWFLQNPAIQNYIISISQRAAGQSGVNKDALEKYQIAIPTIKEQQKIVDYFNQITSYQQQLQQHYKSKLKYLHALKASLLDAAFKGEL